MKQFTVIFLFYGVTGLMVLSGFINNVQAKGMDSGDSDKGIISSGGGIFYPFKGKSGFNGVIQAAGQVSPQERFGVELEFRKYETELLKAKDVDTKSFILRGVGQYFFRPHGISPYIGLGINLAINVFDKDDIERQRSINVKRGWGFGYGIMGLLGVEVPVSGGLVFFGEGRVSGDFQISQFERRSGKDRIRVDSLSGLTGMGGIRIRY